jgi:hypothetical protein
MNMVFENNVVVASPAFHFRLEPGDMTSYKFSFIRLDRAGAVYSGIEAGDGYVLLNVTMGKSGSVIARIESLWEPILPYMGYLEGHGLKIDPYTRAAVVLAMSVLVDSPTSLDDAAKRMMFTPQFLAGEEIDFDG